MPETETMHRVSARVHVGIQSTGRVANFMACAVELPVGLPYGLKLRSQVSPVRHRLTYITKHPLLAVLSGVMVRVAICYVLRADVCEGSIPVCVFIFFCYI
jgi:hypothetical protein